MDVDKLNNKRKLEEERLNHKRNGIVYKRTKERLISPTQEFNNVNEPEKSNSNVTTHLFNNIKNESSSSDTTISVVNKTNKQTIKKYKNKYKNTNEEDEDEQEDKIYKKNVTEDGLNSLFGNFSIGTIIFFGVSIMIGYLVINKVNEVQNTQAYNGTMLNTGIMDGFNMAFGIAPSFIIVIVVIFTIFGAIRMFGRNLD